MLSQVTRLHKGKLSFTRGRVDDAPDGRQIGGEIGGAEVSVHAMAVDVWAEHKFCRV